MREKILIVEDEALIALDMASILEDEGYKVVGIAADLETAFSLTDMDIDLALVDLNLRDGLTGPQIGARLAEEYRVGVVFITANPRLLGDGVAGTIGVLTKPTDPYSLLSAVAFACSLRSGKPAEAPPALKRFQSASAR